MANNQLNEILELAVRSQEISERSETAFKEFAVAVENEDPKAQEEARMKCVELMDMRLDMLVELHHKKKKHREEFIRGLLGRKDK